MHRTTILTLAALILCSGCASPPPTASLDDARTALKVAAAAGAIKKSEAEYRQAEAYLQRGWMEMARQNGRLWFLRNYAAADTLLRRSSGLSRKAQSNSEDQIARLRARANERCENAQKELAEWREALDSSFMNFRAERFWNSAQISVQTARKLFGRGEYESALEEVNSAHRNMGLVASLISEYENDESVKLPTWNKWADDTVADSRRSGSSVMVVDKAAHRVHIYRGGKLLRSFNCDLGYNSANQKMFAGDGATPEGKYQITKIKDGNSKYYRALLLNYPNDDDKQRFALNKRKGVISSRAGIGKLIEIHGEGGQGRDWTDGCVALANKDLDNIMKYVGVGTPVTIVRRWKGNA